VTVADKRDVFALGVVEGDAEDFAGVSGMLKDGADEGVLIAVDGLDLAWWLFHGDAKIPCEAPSNHPPKQSGELEPFRLARLLRTAWKWYQSRLTSIRTATSMGSRLISASKLRRMWQVIEIG
jgi:hypothetical protein